MLWFTNPYTRLRSARTRLESARTRLRSSLLFLSNEKKKQQECEHDWQTGWTAAMCNKCKLISEDPKFVSELLKKLLEPALNSEESRKEEVNAILASKGRGPLF